MTDMDQLKDSIDKAVKDIAVTTQLKEKTLKRCSKAKRFNFEYVRITPLNIAAAGICFCLIMFWSPRIHLNLQFNSGAGKPKHIVTNDTNKKEPVITENPEDDQKGNLASSFKIGNDGTIKTFFSDRGNSDFNTVVDGWTYCIDSDSVGIGIFKENENKKIKLVQSNGRFTNIVYYDGWIYYTRGPQVGKDLLLTGGLYKLDLNGNNEIKLSDQIINTSLLIKDNWIYYSGCTPSMKPNDINLSNNGIFKINTNSSKIVTISNDAANYFDLAESYIYYSNYSDGEKLYKVRNDGLNRQKLNDDERCLDIIVDGNWIYYTKNPYDGHTMMKLPLDNTKGNIYRISIDGTNDTKLNNVSSRLSDVSDGWIYYSDWSKLHKMRLDGSDDTLVN